MTFRKPLSYAGYRDVPVSYLAAEADLFIPVQLQLNSIVRIEKETGSKADVHKLNSGHMMYVLHTGKVVNAILKVAAL